MKDRFVGRGTLLISNGFGSFPLAAVAASLNDSRNSVRLVTGAYPRGRFGALANRAGGRRPSIRRFLDRREPLEPDRVEAVLLGELINQIGVRCARRLPRIGRRFEALAATLFAHRARRVVRSVSDLEIYHVRSGYGGVSLAPARKVGARVFVDHSIAHPRVLPYLVTNGGRMPPAAIRLPRPTDPLWRRVDDDLQRPDVIVVNSDFVASTFARAGVERERVHVVYQGVADQLIDSSEAALERQPSSGRFRIMFAGTVEQRKGVLTLLEALDQEGWRPHWDLDIVGHWDPDLLSIREEVARRPKVTVTSHLHPTELVDRLLRIDVFLFPSWAEGSARVVGIAMAAGCCSVVTPNSGSFLKDGHDGVLTPPGDVRAIIHELTRLDDDRMLTWQLGQQAARTVRRDYRYSHYAKRLEALYVRYRRGT